MISYATQSKVDPSPKTRLMDSEIQGNRDEELYSDKIKGANHS
jgi:hypothetical protein